MINSKNPIYCLIKISLALLLITNPYSAFAGAEIEVGTDDRSLCFLAGTGEICLTTYSTWHQVDTPSDISVFKLVGKDTMKRTDSSGEIISSEVRSFKERYLKKAGELHNSFNRYLDIEFYNDGECYTLVVENKYHMVGGEIIFDKETTEEIACD